MAGSEGRYIRENQLSSNATPKNQRYNSNINFDVVSRSSTPVEFMSSFAPSPSKGAGTKTKGVGVRRNQPSNMTTTQKFGRTSHLHLPKMDSSDNLSRLSDKSYPMTPLSNSKKSHKRSMSRQFDPSITSKDKDVDIDTEAKFINLNLTTLGRIF